jgi:hypothetical protein
VRSSTDSFPLPTDPDDDDDDMLPLAAIAAIAAAVESSVLALDE